MDQSSHWPSKRPPTTDNVGIGRAVARLEDERLLRGGSRYVSDLIATSRALRVKVLRSPHAHARILEVDATAARTLPGVVDVLTANDLTNISDLPCDWMAPGMDVVPQHPVLARDRVRYAGEPLAAVAAETAHAAEDALAAFTVAYENLPAVVDQEAAIKEGVPRLHDAVPSNIAFRFHRAGGDVARAFTQADVVIRRRFANNRVTAAPLEGRAVIGATPAVVNAVIDALAPLGVTEVPIPMTPMRVWRAVERARYGLVAVTTEDSHQDLSPVGKPMHAN
jgi:carbon-monoxide dehydrogenase large subunit